MQVSKIFLSGLKIILLPLMILSLVELKAAQGFSYISTPFEVSSSTGVSDIQNHAIIGITEEEMIVTAERSKDPAASNGKKKSSHESFSRFGSEPGRKKHSKLEKLNSKVKNDEAVKSTIRSKMTKSLRERFKEGEDFHKKWFNMSLPNIKTTLDKLKMFCKTTCTKNLCMDEEIANNCHLICPQSTTHDCPDPLKQKGKNSLGFIKNHNITEESGRLGKLSNSVVSEEDSMNS